VRRPDFIIGCILLVVAGVYFKQSFEIVVGLASDRLGPTFFPRLLAIVLAVLALALIARATTGRSHALAPSPMRSGVLAGVLVATIGYGLLLPWTGFLLITPLLLGAVIWVLGLRSWGKLAGVAIGITVSLYVLFKLVLGVPLPLGILAGS
jgi:putative tricarboxylic transport membrane protein